MCVGCNALVSDSPLMMEYLLLCDYPFLFDVFSPPYVWDVLLVVFVSITNHLCGFCFLNVILIYHWFSLFMFNFKYLVYFINTSVWCSCYVILFVDVFWCYSSQYSAVDFNNNYFRRSYSSSVRATQDTLWVSFHVFTRIIYKNDEIVNIWFSEHCQDST